ncbi:hypothetical protein OROHE_010037 [Orobanche hederae]
MGSGGDSLSASRIASARLLMSSQTYLTSVLNVSTVLFKLFRATSDAVSAPGPKSKSCAAKENSNDPVASKADPSPGPDSKSRKENPNGNAASKVPPALDLGPDARSGADNRNSNTNGDGSSNNENDLSNGDSDDNDGGFLGSRRVSLSEVPDYVWRWGLASTKTYRRAVEMVTRTQTYKWAAEKLKTKKGLGEDLDSLKSTVDTLSIEVRYVHEDIRSLTDAIREARKESPPLPPSDPNSAEK